MTDILTGWVPFEERTEEQHAVHFEIVARMPSFSLPSQGTPEKGTKVCLTDFWKHPKVVEFFGFAYPGVHQLTGSCVGAGGGAALQTLILIECLRLNQPEKLIAPFWLYNYGMSRKRGGMRGRGEGSFGSTFAESVIKDGVLDAFVKELNLPQPEHSDMLVWGSQIEMTWSDGNHAPKVVRDEAIAHPLQSAAPLTSGEQVRDAIINGYPVTRAFGSFTNPGTAKVKNGALIGTYNGRGGHQEAWLNYWNHPQNGEIIYEMNQWGKNAYGTDPGGGPAGGCWISLEDVDRKCQGGEIYAFSQYDGYPAQPNVVDWSKDSFFS